MSTIGHRNQILTVFFGSRAVAISVMLQCNGSVALQLLVDIHRYTGRNGATICIDKDLVSVGSGIHFLNGLFPSQLIVQIELQLHGLLGRIVGIGGNSKLQLDIKPIIGTGNAIIAQILHAIQNSKVLGIVVMGNDQGVAGFPRQMVTILISVRSVETEHKVGIMHVSVVIDVQIHISLIQIAGALIGQLGAMGQRGGESAI